MASIRPFFVSFKQLKTSSHWGNTPSFVFTAVFLCSLLLQFGVFWYMRQAAILDDFSRWSGEISRLLNYTDRWDLTRLRQAETAAPHYCVLDKDGLLIDVAGYFPELQFRVAPIQSEVALKTTFIPETGESWRMLVHRLQDGIVILGASPPDDVTNIDEKLIDNAKHFGSSIAEAILVDVAMIDKNLDYALIDDSGRIRSAYGGIPLKVINWSDPAIGQVDQINSDSGISYGIFASSFVDKAGRIVGKIVVFDKMPLKAWQSWRAWVIFLLSSSLLAVVVVFLFHRIRPHSAQIAGNDLESRIRCGETKTLEFKSSLRWNSFKKGFDIQIENAVLKTIVAFCNTEGGELLIGVSDDGTILGIENDGFKNPDKFLLHIRNLIVDRIIPKTVLGSIDYEIISLEGKPICHVICTSSSEDIWLKPDTTTPEQFFVRSRPSSTPLSPKEAVAYIQKHFKKTKAPVG